LNYPQNLPLRYLGKIIKIIICATTNETKDRLDDLGIIKALIKIQDFLVKQIFELSSNQNIQHQNENEQPYTHEKLIFDALKLLFMYCQFSKDRSEQAVSYSFIQIAATIINLNDSKINRLLLDLLSEFVTTSELTREEMWNSVNGPHMLVALLNK